MRRISVLVLAVALFGSAPSASGSDPAPFESCTADSVEALVRAFGRAYNTGDVERLDAMWAPEPDFEWYSVSPDERERDAAYDRETLIPYFARRHGLHDRLRFKSLRIGPPNDAGHYGISYNLTRRSDQSRARGEYHGKAGATEVMALPSLDHPTLSRCMLIVWSMGKT